MKHQQPKNEEDIEVRVDYEKILSIKDITQQEIDSTVEQCINWMLSNPKKITDNVLRTGRVLQFLKDKPNIKDATGILRSF